MKEELDKFVNFLLVENEKHNLIGKSTIDSIWKRHIEDSLQLVRYIDERENYNSIVDIGSGAGFPVIPIGIELKDRRMNNNIILIEKSPVKCEFLRKSCEILKLNYKIINQSVNEDNIAKFIPQNSIITSRAFKSLDEILCLVDKVDMILKVILLKGEKWQDEVFECRQKHKKIFEKWNMKVEKSITGVGVIIILNKKK